MKILWKVIKLDVLSYYFHINDLSNIKKRFNDKLFEELGYAASC